MKQLKWLGAVGAAWVLSAAGAAQAGNVYWSVGVHQPGVHVGVSNTPPVVVQYPVVVHAPRQVVVPPPHRVGWVPPGHRYQPSKHHARHAHPKQQQVTHVHYHHYHTSPAPQVVYAAPPVRPHWR